MNFIKKLIRDIVFPAPSIYSTYDVVPDSYTYLTTGMKRESFLYEGLETVEFNPPANKSSNIYVIHFLGNAGCVFNSEHKFSDTSKLMHAKNWDTNILFNMPGVCGSKGNYDTKNCLVDAGIKQVQRLLNKGIPPEKIILSGHSLGSAIATLVAEHFHKDNKRIYLFNDRSFATTSDYVSAHLRYFFKPESILGYISIPLTWGIIYPIVKAISYIAIRFSDWNIDAGKAYANIPQKYKDYIVIHPKKSAKERRAIDGVIPMGNDIHSFEKYTRRRHKKIINEFITNATKLLKNPKTDFDILKTNFRLCIDNEKSFKDTKAHKMIEEVLMCDNPTKFIEKFKEVSRFISNDHKFEAVDLPHTYFAHNTPLSELRQRSTDDSSGISAEDYFKNFVSRTKE